ncbi:MAG: hypothetical protein AAGF86_20435, partial [Pseudomonadota bacterium]
MDGFTPNKWKFKAKEFGGLAEAGGAANLFAKALRARHAELDEMARPSLRTLAKNAGVSQRGSKEEMMQGVLNQEIPLLAIAAPTRSPAKTQQKPTTSGDAVPEAVGGEAADVDAAGLGTH